MAQTDVGDGDVRPVLVIEVSMTSLRYDSTIKARLFAQSGIPECWVLDLASSTVEVLRDPANGEWGSRTTHGTNGTLERRRSRA